jgi:ketosteroid isomerase-like protein
MRKSKGCSLLLISLFFLLAPAGSPAESKAAAALRAADQQWETAVAAKDLDKSVGACAADGSVLPPNAPIATGPAAIRKLFEGFFALPGFKIQWNADTAEVAKAGDLGYTRGTYQLVFNDASGQPVTDKGKYVTVWKKQGDGSWKVAADIFNSDRAPSK